MRKSMVILLLAWWLVAPAWGAELPREVRDALPAAAEEITEELEAAGWCCWRRRCCAP